MKSIENTTKHITDLIDSLSECDRLTVGGVEYVAYTDGAYVCVLPADEWDAPMDLNDQQRYSNDQRGYDRWCDDYPSAFDDLILQQMSNHLGRRVFDGCGFTSPE